MGHIPAAIRIARIQSDPARLSILRSLLTAPHGELPLRELRRTAEHNLGRAISLSTFSHLCVEIEGQRLMEPPSPSRYRLSAFGLEAMQALKAYQRALAQPLIDAQLDKVGRELGPEAATRLQSVLPAALERVDPRTGRSGAPRDEIMPAVLSILRVQSELTRLAVIEGLVGAGNTLVPFRELQGDVIRALSQDGAARVLPASTLSNLLSHLTSEGLIARESDGSSRLTSLGFAAVQAFSIYEDHLKRPLSEALQREVAARLGIEPSALDVLGDTNLPEAANSPEAGGRKPIRPRVPN